MKQIKDYLDEEKLNGLGGILQPHIESQKNNPEATERKNQIIRTYGSIDEFLNKVQFELITSPESPHIDTIYPIFETVFKNPLEKESADAIRFVLSDGFKEQFEGKMGEFNTSFIVARNPGTDDFIGGILFNNYTLPKEISRRTGAKGTNHIEYIFVEPSYKKTGLGQALYNKMRHFSHNKFSGMDAENALHRSERDSLIKSGIYFFADVEAPELVFQNESKDWYTQKPELLAEQLLRLAWWDKMGFKRVDFPFIQSPLEEGMEPCRIFSINVKYEGLPQFSLNGHISSDVVKEHIKKYLAINVLKGRNPESDEHYVKQMEILSKSPHLNTLEINKVYSDMSKYVGQNLFRK